MSIIESLAVSLFCIALVFFVLVFLFILVKILSKVINMISVKIYKIPVVKTEISQVTNADENTDVNGISTGELKLINVDEKTAAMIMAIVSHESQIPLSELMFKSIKAIEES